MLPKPVEPPVGSRGQGPMGSEGGLGEPRMLLTLLKYEVAYTSGNVCPSSCVALTQGSVTTVGACYVSSSTI
jgi:hypothetical protein